MKKWHLTLALVLIVTSLLLKNHKCEEITIFDRNPEDGYNHGYCDSILQYLIPKDNKLLQFKANIHFGISTNNISFQDDWEIKLTFSEGVTDLIADTLQVNKNQLDWAERNEDVSQSIVGKSRIVKKKRLNKKEFMLSGSWKGMFLNMNRPNLIYLLVEFVAKYSDGTKYVELEKVTLNQKLEICQGTYRCGIGKYVPSTLELISGGTPVEEAEFPWLAAIYRRNIKSEENISWKFGCGGTLISDQFVLTAAHCIDANESDYNLSDYIVYLGKYELPSEHNVSSEYFKVIDIKPHPQYNFSKNAPSSSRHADIALFKLHKKTKFSNDVRPVCLHFRLKESIPSKSLVVGWGYNECGTQERRPKMVDSPIVSLNVCRNCSKVFSDLTSNLTMCAGQRNGAGPCKGDSGGGLLSPFQLPGDTRIRYHIEGIVARGLSLTGTECADLRNYLIYTNVSSFQNWIYENTNALITRRNQDEHNYLPLKPTSDFCDKLLTRYNSSNKLNASFTFTQNKAEIHNQTWSIEVTFANTVTQFAGDVYVSTDLSDKVTLLKTFFENNSNETYEEITQTTFSFTGNWSNALHNNVEEIIIKVNFVAKYTQESNFTEITLFKFNNEVICEENDSCGIPAYDMDAQETVFPWLAAIVKNNPLARIFICSGTLITEKHVLTAAPKIIKKKKSKLEVFLGKYGLFPEQQVPGNFKSFKVNDIITHPVEKFAIFILNGEVDRNDPLVAPICYQPAYISTPNKHEGKVEGWGFYPANGIPKKYISSIVSSAQCLKYNRYFNLTSEHTFCARYINGSEKCSGDSGEGYYTSFKLFGENRPRYHIEGIVNRPLTQECGEYLMDESNCDYNVYANLSSFKSWFCETVESDTFLPGCKRNESTSLDLPYCDSYLHRYYSNRNELSASLIFKIKKAEIQSNNSWQINFSFSEPVTDIIKPKWLYLYPKIVEFGPGHEKHNKKTIYVQEFQNQNNKSFTLSGKWGEINQEISWNILYITVPFLIKYNSEGFTYMTALKFNDEKICNGTLNCGLVHETLKTSHGIGHFPWLASIYSVTQIESRFVCAGSLISNKLILTSASCMMFTYRRNLQIFLGYNERFPNTYTQVFKVKAIFIHPDFQNIDNAYEADIAVLVMDKKAKLNEFVGPVCLHFRHERLPQYTVGNAVGWGLSNYGLVTGSAKKISMQTLPPDQCRDEDKIFKTFTFEKQFCAGIQNDSHSCIRDHGGGFYSTFKLPGDKRERYHIDGVLSTALRPPKNYYNLQCDLLHARAYTDVHAFRYWLRDDIGANITWRNHIPIMTNTSEPLVPPTPPNSIDYCDKFLTMYTPTRINELNGRIQFRINKTLLNFHYIKWEMTMVFSTDIINFYADSLSVKDAGIHYNNDIEECKNCICEDVKLVLDSAFENKINSIRKINGDRNIIITGIWKNIDPSKFSDVMLLDLKFTAIYTRHDLYTQLINVTFNKNEICQGTYRCGISSSVDNSQLIGIEGKQNVTRGEFPWIAAIFKKPFSDKKYLCSGTLISDQLVLTAAVCSEKDGLTVSSLLVYLGKYELFEDDNADHNVQVFNVAKIILHRDYEQRTIGMLDADIALFKLDRRAELNDFVRPVCLNFRTHQYPTPGTTGNVVGWGMDDTGNAYGVPKKIKLPIVSLDKCRRDNDKFINLTTHRTFCAGLKDGAGPCFGDKGVGFYTKSKLPGDYRSRFHLEGIFSKSLARINTKIVCRSPLHKKCKKTINMCNLKQYSVYTDVYSFKEWLYNSGAHITFQEINQLETIPWVKNYN